MPSRQPFGCKPRGRQSDGPFNHDTGKGWVKGKQGEYHDALFNQNNRVEIVLHENLGGGFSPPAAPRKCGATAARPKTTESTARPTTGRP